MLLSSKFDDDDLTELKRTFVFLHSRVHKKSRMTDRLVLSQKTKYHTMMMEGPKEWNDPRFFLNAQVSLGCVFFWFFHRQWDLEGMSMSVMFVGCSTKNLHKCFQRRVVWWLLVFLVAVEWCAGRGDVCAVNRVVFRRMCVGEVWLCDLYAVRLPFGSERISDWRE